MGPKFRVGDNVKVGDYETVYTIGAYYYSERAQSYAYIMSNCHVVFYEFQLSKVEA